MGIEGDRTKAFCFSVAFIRKFVLASSDLRDLVIDLFFGLRTTLVVDEQLGRTLSAIHTN
ncbi:DNA methyltransferase [Leptolyngbya sp. Cla-17]|uniref:DNA methyltransferase n=1 Tax=Leptolyngbya sp. Cla-17 TaxID=2803751 RepID=UPI0039F57D68